MLYRNGDLIVSRSAAIDIILSQLNTVVVPSYIDDETLALYGFLPEPNLDVTTRTLAPTQEQRKVALSSADWIVGATQLCEQTKAAVESWRWLVRNLPEINPEANIPPLPRLIQLQHYNPAVMLSNVDINAVKNYPTPAYKEGWLEFISVWKSLGYPEQKQVVGNLLIAYTNVTLDEIIGSI